MNCRTIGLLLGLALLLLFCSCSKKRDYGKATYPVSGTVYVDGEPAAMLSVSIHDVNGMDTQVPSVSAATTNNDGTFSVSTFESGDGVPAGNYVVTFKWGKYNPISKSFDGDQLKGRYSNLEKSEFKLTVVEGQPTDMGTILLTTK